MDASILANVAFAGIAVLGAILSVLGLAAFRRTRSGRLGLVAAAFLLLAAEGIVVAIGLFTGGWSPSSLLLLVAGAELAVLVLLFGATLTG